MPSDTTEAALETCIERFLTGGISVSTPIDGTLPEDPAPYKASKGVGYVRGQSADFNATFAIDESKFWQFLEATQAVELAKLHYKPKKRKETERFKRFTYEELIARDKANLDILWLKDDSLEDSENLPPPAELALDIIESLEIALEEFRSVEDSLANKTEK